MSGSPTYETVRLGKPRKKVFEEKKSFFLFGPRGTGKTTLIQRTLPDVTMIDLLEIKTYREYLKNPSIDVNRNP
jgi:predicted AAA+ superfamily ATPase